MRLFYRLLRLDFLLGAAIFYVLGAGIAHYQGAALDWPRFGLGLLWLWLVQMGAHLLYALYGVSPDDARRESLSPQSLLIAAAACFTVAASLSVLIIQAVGFSPVIFAAQLILFLGAFFYAAPPVRLAFSGYGELIAAVLVANLVPVLAFHLQAGESIRLVAMSTFPLTLFLLAALLAWQLPGYAADLKLERQTLLVRAGWQNGMFLHNALILGGFLILALALVMGLPFGIAWPLFLLLPLGGLQIWTLQGIQAGAKPHWRSWKIAAAALPVLAAYLLAFTYWIR